MAALSLRKKEICALVSLVMPDKVDNEDTFLLWNADTALSYKHGFFLLWLLVVPHLLFPFFQILFFKFFNKNIYFK